MPLTVRSRVGSIVRIALVALAASVAVAGGWGVAASFGLTASAQAGGQAAPPRAAALGMRFTPPLRNAADLASGWEIDGTGVWSIADGRLVLEKAGVPAGTIRRPSALAISRAAPMGDVTMELEVRSTAALPEQTPKRDLLLVFGYQSPTRFYYVHISAARDAVHNGIFLVADADRRRIDTLSEKAVLTDQAWHRVRLVRKAATGQIELFVDGGAQPIMTATDTTLASGRVGVGSFDDTGEFRAIHITGDVR